MSEVRSFVVRRVQRKDIRAFIEKWHYSHSINGLMSTYCFGLYRESELIGAMILGSPAMANQWKKYGQTPEEVIELRRLACIDDTPKNTESYFIGKVLRELRQTEISTVISYADANYGHEGIIYKASNFELIGKTAKGKVILWKGKKYHDKAIRTKYKGDLKPFARRLVEALSLGEAKYVQQLPKNIYLYRVRK